ncbi:MAG: cation:proton antiporter [Armatimonadota bacterium]
MEHQASQFILYLIMILVAAKLFGELAERIGQPPVLGELVAGIVLGSSILGWITVPSHGAMSLSIGGILLLAQLGVILLLFEVGLESDLEEFLRVGPSALLVAVIGVVGPFVVGYYTSRLLGMGAHTAIFIGATLTATSVGITARTFSDLGRLRTPEAKVILGAAVIDDVLGLIILAIVTSLVANGSVSGCQIGITAGLAIAFLVGAIVIGVSVTPHLLSVAKRLRTRGILTISAFLFCLILAFVAEQLRLAAIVGAFAAGLVLARTEDLAHIQARIKPIADILVPIFFVSVGLSVDLGAFKGRETLSLIGILVLVATTMKLLSGVGVLRKGLSRTVVGVGMIPRGEVGLIFAVAGRALGVIDAREYTAIVAVVVITTFITPPLLKLILAGARKRPVEA